jgi:hypothetical protein
MTGSAEPKSADLKSLTDRKNLPEQERWATATRVVANPPLPALLDHGEAAPGYASRNSGENDPRVVVIVIDECRLFGNIREARQRRQE